MAVSTAAGATVDMYHAKTSFRPFGCVCRVRLDQIIIKVAMVDKRIFYLMLAASSQKSASACVWSLEKVASCLLGDGGRGQR